MKKALFAAAVAVAAAVGVVVAIVVSSGNEQKPAAPAPTGASSSQATTGDTNSGSAPTTTATTPNATDPVDTSALRLPPPPGRNSTRRQTLVVGVVDDALAQQSRSFAQAQVDISHDAGFDAAIVSATWKRGQRRPPRSLVHALGNVAAAARKDDMRLFVVVWHGLARETPRTPSERADFAEFCAAVVKTFPSVRGVIVGNEPNLNTFWAPQFGAGGRDLAAVAYLDLLARSYDAIKAADAGVQVLGGALAPRGADRPGGSRPTHSPTAFIRDLGSAYRASGRKRPLMDAFAFHPYMQASRVPPTASHPTNTSITVADYPKLVALLEEAFKGTAQPSARLPIYYTEFGVQTNVPPPKLRFYSDPGFAGRSDSVGFDLQAAYYRTALALAYCQPTVRGIFIFHTFDEADFAGWQSGLYFADATPKPSLPAFKRAVADLRSGKLTTCR
ncbi:MAG: hypothetical protein QOD43_841 [Gaiellaceae bacterium]|nr:hypothetical protein [Gaiellaceae bacterium]